MTVVVSVASKPDLQSALRSTWRKSAEHKAAQVKRFLYAMGAVVASNIMGDVVAHKDPLAHFTDLRTAWYYLIPFAYVAWKQAHPSMSASEVDSAPGATIVPDQVGAQAVDTSVDNSVDPAVDPQAGDVSVDNLPAESSDSENSVTDLPDPAANEFLPLVAPLPVVPKKKVAKKTSPK